MITVQHPRIAGVRQAVNAEQLDEWIAAGWLPVIRAELHPDLTGVAVGEPAEPSTPPGVSTHPA